MHVKCVAIYLVHNKLSRNVRKYYLDYIYLFLFPGKLVGIQYSLYKLSQNNLSFSSGKSGKYRRGKREGEEMSKCNKLYIYSLNCLTWSSLTLSPILWVFLYLSGHSSVPIGLFADDSLTLPRISILIALVFHPPHSSLKHMPMPMVSASDSLLIRRKFVLTTDG